MSDFWAEKDSFFEYINTVWSTVYSNTQSIIKTSSLFPVRIYFASPLRSLSFAYSKPNDSTISSIHKMIAFSSYFIELLCAPNYVCFLFGENWRPVDKYFVYKDRLDFKYYLRISKNVSQNISRLSIFCQLLIYE